jgi:hypothetical protein
MIPPECVVEPGANQGLHGTFQIPGNALREESYPQPRRNHQGSLIGLLDSGQNLQQGGFPLPIPTYQSDPLTPLDLEVGVVQERPITEEDPEILATDQGHDSLEG